LILGNTDCVDIDLRRGTVSVEGRDLSGPLIDTKTQQKYQNLTSSQIVSQVAQQFALTPNVTATSTLTGRYYEIDHARLTNDISYWTLLTYLAQEEGFDVFVSGSTLNFQPSAQGGQPGHTIQYTPPTEQSIQQGNFMDLKLHRSQTLAKGAVVKVVSWNSKQRASFTATAKSSLKGDSPASGAGQLYPYTMPGLTMEQAQNFANARLKEISLHERVVELDIPGELTLQPRQLVSLTGTGTSFDQAYYIDRINRRVDVDGGFRESIRMKNHSPESTVDA
jgi:phage protein D